MKAASWQVSAAGADLDSCEAPARIGYNRSTPAPALGICPAGMPRSPTALRPTIRLPILRVMAFVCPDRDLSIHQTRVRLSGSHRLHGMAQICREAFPPPVSKLPTWMVKGSDMSDFFNFQNPPLANPRKTHPATWGVCYDGLP